MHKTSLAMRERRGVRSSRKVNANNRAVEP
jgi:hypothetical protein